MSRIRNTLFQAYARLKRPMTLGVRAAVENSAGHVCLVRHTYTPGWYLPGGGIERGEPALEAITRELVEEAGIQLSGRPDLFGFYSNHAIFPNDHVALYRVTHDMWTETPATSKGEIAEIRWVDPKTPPEDITPGNRQRLLELYADAPVSPFWPPPKSTAR